jgi:hypothetical protein
MTIVELVKEYFKTQKWQYSQVEGKDVFILGINGDNGKFQCIVDISTDINLFSFYSICGFDAPENKRKEVAELLTRLNYAEAFGNFEMDFEDGEISYRTSMYYQFFEPTVPLIENMIMANIVSMDDSLPSIIGVIFQNLTPLDAFKLSESKENSEPGLV